MDRIKHSDGISKNWLSKDPSNALGFSTKVVTSSNSSLSVGHEKLSPRLFIKQEI